MKTGQSKLMRLIAAILVRAIVMLTVCAIGGANSGAGEQLEVRWSAVPGTADGGTKVDLANWKVVAFLGAECPLARLYGKRLSKLAEEYRDAGVRVVGVNSNPQDSADDLQQYIKEHDITFPVFKDHDQSWAREFGATRTPEVFVLDADDRVRYQGRIDDQYEPGIARAAPTRHDLRDALFALVAGEPAPVAKTQAVGCLITYVKPERKASAADATVTFTRDVAPILNQHCVECHREGEIGPFALTDYDEVVGWGEMMLEVIDQGRMPPWHADPKYGKFLGARSMSDEHCETLAAWVEQGMAEGDAADLPVRPHWNSGWHLRTSPDEELAMRERPYKVSAQGIVEYQYFVVDPGWEEERWVRAAQVMPGNSAVVHHAIVFVRPPDGADVSGIGWLGAYVPGQRTSELPVGHARRIPANSKLVFQMHYTPNGRETDDVTNVGVWFAEPTAVTHEVVTRVALNHDFEIPPGVADHTVKFQNRGFARGSRLLSATPHMHLRGKSFRLTARDAKTDRKETLLHVPRYDFNWQHWYQFESPLSLDDIAALDIQVSFDNSAENPTNPDPNSFVSWGDQTWEEMAVAFFDVAHPRDKPREFVSRQGQPSPEDVARFNIRIAKEVNRFLAELDQDGDGVVIRDEVPEAFRRFAFRRIDHNRDGKIDRSEIEEEAAQRL